MPHLYQEIAESIRRQIATGELSPGDLLPTVRQLAARWGCTPGTANRAYRELAGQGLVSGHRGNGTRVLETRLLESRPDLEWASLVNRAERYLLEALGSGHSSVQAQAAVAMAVSRWQTIQDEPAPLSRRTPGPAQQLRFSGSHDLAVELLAQLVHEPGMQAGFALSFTGSLGGLMALAREEADLAGVHLWDATTDSYNLPFIRRILPNRRLAILSLVHRRLGIMVPQGNPQKLEKLEDLARPGVHLMNRQPGSGTRVWLDEQLLQSRIAPADIPGYSQEGTTHMAVAQAVQLGQATAGLGIQAAAMAYGLSFLPLTEEMYQLVIPEEVWEHPICQKVRQVVGSYPFRSAVANLGGYNTDHSGELFWTQDGSKTIAYGSPAIQ